MAQNPAKCKLTARQERFCEEYLIDLNATQAAARAGYSKKNADKIGSELLGKTGVAARVQELKAARTQRVEVTADTVLRELLRLATVDLAQAYTPEGKLKNIHEIPEDVRRAIAGVEVFEEFEGFGKDREHVGDTVKVKFYDKNKSLELLGKHLKLFTDKVEHSGTVTLEDLVSGSKEEEKK